MMDVHTAELGAARQCRYRLAGVEQAIGIKSLFYGMELLQFGFIELYAHLVDLFHTDTVLAGNDATHLDAKFQDTRTECLGTFQFAGFVGIVEDQRVKVAVTGVEYIRNREAVFFRPLRNRREHLAEVFARNGAVHTVIVG